MSWSNNLKSYKIAIPSVPPCKNSPTISTQSQCSPFCRISSRRDRIEVECWGSTFNSVSSCTDIATQNIYLTCYLSIPVIKPKAKIKVKALNGIFEECGAGNTSQITMFSAISAMSLIAMFPIYHHCIAVIIKRIDEYLKLPMIFKVHEIPSLDLLQKIYFK